MESTENKRSGDKAASPYQSSRFYSVANEWYFSVREAGDQGPYSSKLSAENGLKIYLLDNEYFSTKKTLRISNLKLI